MVTAEGYESMFALNYLGRFALTQRFLPLLETGSTPSENARILLLSGAAQIGRIHFRDVHLTKNFSTVRAVAQFCRANDVFTLELARRLASSKASSNISIACLKIGVVKTNIRSEFPMWMKILVPLVFDPLLGQPVSEVANSALRLLLEKQFERPGGGLFLQIRRFRPLKPSRSLTDPDQGRQLFDLSEQLVLRATRGTSSAVPLYAAADTPGTVTLC